MPPYTLHTPEDVAQTLAQRVRALRLERGWKQSTLASRSGVSLGSLRRFEQSGRASLPTTLKLAFALGRLDDFLRILEPLPATSIEALEALDGAQGRQRGTR